MIEVKRDDFFVESIKNPTVHAGSAAGRRYVAKLWNRISMDE